MGYKNVPLNLRNDTSFQGAEYFDSQAEVFARIKEMVTLEGWRPTRHGLSMVGDDGPILAKPIMIKDHREFSGIGYWSLSPDDDELI